MYEMCPYCHPDTGGNHQLGCPNCNVKTIIMESSGFYPAYNPNEYRKIDPDKMPAGTASVAFTLELGKSLEYIGITSEEYNCLKLCEAELTKYKAEAEKIPRRCISHTIGSCELIDHDAVKCPIICPKYRGGEKG